MVIYWPISKAPTRTGTLTTGLRYCTLCNPLPPSGSRCSPAVRGYDSTGKEQGLHMWLCHVWLCPRCSPCPQPPPPYLGHQTVDFRDYGLPEHMHSVDTPSDCSDVCTAVGCHSLIWSESILSPVSAWDLYVSSSPHALLSTINKRKWDSIINHCLLQGFVLKGSGRPRPATTSCG